MGQGIRTRGLRHLRADELRAGLALKNSIGSRRRSFVGDGSKSQKKGIREETMRRLLPTLSAIALTLSFIGWTQSADAASLRVGIGEDTDTLDPAQGRTFGGRQIFAALCDKLFDLDP